MHSYLIQAATADLSDWGTPEDLGAETLEGSVRIAGRIDLGSTDGAVLGGVYSATRGAYRVVYPFHEHATLLEGQLKLTDEATGTATAYGPGDSWIIRKGTPVPWEITTERVAKSFLATTIDV